MCAFIFNGTCLSAVHIWFIFTGFYWYCVKIVIVISLEEKPLKLHNHDITHRRKQTVMEDSGLFTSVMVYIFIHTRACAQTHTHAHLLTKFIGVHLRHRCIVNVSRIDLCSSGRVSIWSTNAVSHLQDFQSNMLRPQQIWLPITELLFFLVSKTVSTLGLFFCSSFETLGLMLCSLSHHDKVAVPLTVCKNTHNQSVFLFSLTPWILNNIQFTAWRGITWMCTLCYSYGIFQEITQKKYI